MFNWQFELRQLAWRALQAGLPTLGPEEDRALQWLRNGDRQALTEFVETPAADVFWLELSCPDCLSSQLLARRGTPLQYVCMDCGRKGVVE